MDRFVPYADLCDRIDRRLDRDAEVEPSGFPDYECARGYHASLKADDAKWARLIPAGTQQAKGYALDLRTCPGCCSTLARKAAA